MPGLLSNDGMWMLPVYGAIPVLRRPGLIGYAHIRQQSSYIIFPHTIDTRYIFRSSKLPAFQWMHVLQQACEVQIQALAGARPLTYLPPDAIKEMQTAFDSSGWKARLASADPGSWTEYRPNMRMSLFRGSAAKAPSSASRPKRRRCIRRFRRGDERRYCARQAVVGGDDAGRPARYVPRRPSRFFRFWCSRCGTLSRSATSSSGCCSAPPLRSYIGVIGFPAARIADTGNRKRLILCGALLWAGCTVASGFAQSFGQLLLLRAGLALGEAAIFPASHSLVADLLPRNAGRSPPVLWLRLPFWAWP